MLALSQEFHSERIAACAKISSFVPCNNGAGQYVLIPTDMRALLCLLVAAGAVMAADTAMTVDQLVSFVQSSVKNHISDKEVADYLRRVKLSYRLDDRTIEDLQGSGAGSRTVAALRDLQHSAASLPPPPAAKSKAAPPPPPPPPSLADQGKIIEAARDYALNYTKQLPNYICLQVTRRYADNSVKNAPGDEFWRLIDTFATRLSYNEQKEDYKVVMVNNRPVENISMEKLGGAVSAGEFGSMMRAIFVPESEARFDWDHWGTLRGRPVYVFSYDIDQPHSQYHIKWEDTLDITSAYRGLIYIDRDSNMIVRITQEAYNIPVSFPVQAVKEVLDYDLQKIGDGEFLVPLRVVVTSRTTKYLSKNEVEFRLYKKFGADATIKFEEIPAEPLPEEKTKDR
jgi:hypothetical protein